MNHINQLYIIRFVQQEMSFTSHMYCNHSPVSAVSPENAPEEMDVIKLELRPLYTESDWYHSNNDDSGQMMQIHMILAYHAVTRTVCIHTYQYTDTFQRNYNKLLYSETKHAKIS